MGGAGPAGSSVLVVDDDLDIRLMISQALELEGWRVTTAANGREALDRLITGERPRMILLDVMMPVMSGWEVLQALRGDDALRSIPVVLISGDDSVGARLPATGATTFLRKPIDLSVLLDTVARYA